MIMTLLHDPAAWAALATLIVMEVVLGIDNLIFISILSNKLPEGQRVRVRRVGIGLALVLRLALLSTIALDRAGWSRRCSISGWSAALTRMASQVSKPPFQSAT